VCRPSCIINCADGRRGMPWLPAGLLQCDTQSEDPSWLELLLALRASRQMVQCHQPNPKSSSQTDLFNSSWKPPSTVPKMTGETQTKRQSAGEQPSPKLANISDENSTQRSVSPARDPPSPPTLAHFAGSMGTLMQVCRYERSKPRPSALHLWSHEVYATLPHCRSKLLHLMSPKQSPLLNRICVSVFLSHLVSSMHVW